VRDIRGFSIMDGDQLGYSDSYTYFTRDYHEAESLLAEVRMANPSMRVVTAVLVVDDLGSGQPRMPADIPFGKAHNPRPPGGYPRDNPYPSIGKCDACGKPATHMCRDIRRTTDLFEGTKKDEVYGPETTGRGCDEHPVESEVIEVFKELPLP